MSTLEVRRLDASLREEFYRLHESGTDLGWCRCVAWWVNTWDGWGERTAEENLELRERLFDRGEYDGYLGFVDGAPVAWCQVGPRDRLEKLTRELHLVPDEEAWAVTCFLVAPAVRRTGIAAALLTRVLGDLKERGVARVEAFPRAGDGLGEREQWNGGTAMYERAGFECSAASGSRAVYSLNL